MAPRVRPSHWRRVAGARVIGSGGFVRTQFMFAAEYLSRRRWSVAAALVCLGLVACRSPRPAPGPLLLDVPLDAFPAETRILLGLDLARLRASGVWAQLRALAAPDPADEARLADLKKRTGLDLLRDLEGLVVAFPEEARRTGQFALAVTAPRFDEGRLAAAVVPDAGADSVRTRNGHRLYALGEGAGAFLPDPHHGVIGAGGWAERLADQWRAGSRATSRPAGTGGGLPPELLGLLTRVGLTHAIVGAALMPASLRQTFAADRRLAVAAEVQRLAVVVDVDRGLAVALTAEFVDRTAAGRFVAGVRAALADARRDPRLLLVGGIRYLDGVAVATREQRAELTLRLDDATTRELFSRLGALRSLGVTR